MPNSILEVQKVLDPESVDVTRNRGSAKQGSRQFAQTNSTDHDSLGQLQQVLNAVGHSVSLSRNRPTS